jgi:hypothetical protein
VVINSIEQRWRSEEKKGSGAWPMWPFTVAGSPVITRHAPHDSPRREPALRHVVRDGDSTTAVRTLSERSVRRGGARRLAGMEPSSPTAMHFHSGTLSTRHPHESKHPRHESRRRYHRRWEFRAGSLIQSRLLYHREFQSDEPDSQCWTRISSKFTVVTDLSLYTKVTDL